MLKPEPEIKENFVKHFGFCNLPYHRIILASTGQVSMCCHQKTQLGMLDENTEILDLWNSKVAKEIREYTSNGKLHPVCQSWNVCPFILREKEMYHIDGYRRAHFPIYLEMCLPDKHCNIGGETPDEKNPACLMCRRNFEKPSHPDLTDLMCRKAKPLMPYLQFLSVLGIAEPFWKDAVFKIFDKLEFERYSDNICFTTNTNGICLNENVANKFFSMVKKSDIAWSLDSANPETHMKLRRLDAYDLVIKNLKRWLQMRKDFGGPQNHKVIIYNNINMLNVSEMTQMVEVAHEVGVDKMIMLPTTDQLGAVQLGELILCEKNVKIFKHNAEKAMKKAQELGLSLLYTKRFDVVPPPIETLVQLESSTEQLSVSSEEALDIVQLEIPQKKELRLVQLELPLKKELIGIKKFLRKIP